MINKDTDKLFSVAAKAGNFGATIYNRLFRLFGINAVYLPLEIHPRIHFSRTFEALTIVGAKGINVSMPFKFDAKTCAYNYPFNTNVNTLVLNDGIWEGHNTDHNGFLGALNTIVHPTEIKSVWIFGTGALASTITKSMHMISENIKVRSYKEYPDEDVDLVVNASPVGMEGIKQFSPWNEFVSRGKYVFDAVVSRPGIETDLVKVAKEKKKPVASGHQMSMYGLMHQFFHHYPRCAFDDIQKLVFQEVKEMGYEI